MNTAPADKGGIDVTEEQAVELVRNELALARQKFGPFHSAHEGYAILLEEVDELWAEVKRRPEDVDVVRMAREAVQVAAMAVRFLMDICG